jgi:hypothetical protein
MLWPRNSTDLLLQVQSGSIQIIWTVGHLSAKFRQEQVTKKWLLWKPSEEGGIGHSHQSHWPLVGGAIGGDTIAGAGASSCGYRGVGRGNWLAEGYWAQ